VRLTVWIITAFLGLASASFAEQLCRAHIQTISQPLNTCLGAERVKIAAVGDVLLHRPLQQRGYSDADGFYAIWAQAAPIFKAADIAYANLEGPVAPGIAKGGREVTDPGAVFDDRVYSSFPMFNYHTRVLGDLKRAGIDIVSTANNHALDRGPIGADRTIDQLRAARLPFTGTIKTGELRAFTTYTDTKLGRLAWIACSYSTNGLPDPNAQMLMCFEDRAEVLSLVTQAAKRSDVAGVIVTPHWGYEYNHSPNKRQKTLAADLMAAGASAVIGTHPHVIQPWEALPSTGDHKGLAIYSTGNFVSGQVKPARRIGTIAWVEMCRPMPSQDLADVTGPGLVIASSGWVPVRMERTNAGPKLAVGETAGNEALKLHERYLPQNGISTSVQCHDVDATLYALQ